MSTTALAGVTCRTLLHMPAVLCPCSFHALKASPPRLSRSLLVKRVSQIPMATGTSSTFSLSSSNFFFSFGGRSASRGRGRGVTRLFLVDSCQHESGEHLYEFGLRPGGSHGAGGAIGAACMATGGASGANGPPYRTAHGGWNSFSLSGHGRVPWE